MSAQLSDAGIDKVSWETEAVAAAIIGGDVVISIRCGECKDIFQYTIPNDKLHKMCSKSCRAARLTRLAQERAAEYAAQHPEDSRPEFVCNSCGETFRSYECHARKLDGTFVCKKCRELVIEERRQLHEKIYHMRAVEGKTFRQIHEACGRSYQRVLQIYHKVARQKARMQRDQGDVS